MGNVRYVFLGYEARPRSRGSRRLGRRIVDVVQIAAVVPCNRPVCPRTPLPVDNVLVRGVLLIG